MSTTALPTPAFTIALLAFTRWNTRLQRQHDPDHGQQPDNTSA
jgi:hypothetical protein